MAEIDERENEDSLWRDRYQAGLAEWEEQERRAQAELDSLRRAVLRVSLAADGVDQRLDEQLDALRESVRGAVEPLQLDRLVQQIADTILSLEGARQPRSDDASPASTPGLWQRLFGGRPQAPRDATGRPARAAAQLPPAVRQTLNHLMDKLWVPDELRPIAQRIRARLKQDLALAELPETLEEIVGLVLDSTRGETQEIENFLRELADRLADIDGFLQQSAHSQQASDASNHTLDHDIRSHVQGIEASLREAADLDQLKGRVSVQLESIVSSMDQFRVQQRRLREDADRRVTELTEQLRQTEAETQELRATLLQQKLRAQLDPLTRLANRQAYSERLEYEHARWQRYGSPLTLLVADIDRFKDINDRFGHSAGDKVLKSVARVLQNNLRTTDFLSRYGGEEFVILMPETPLEAALTTAEKLRQAVEARPFRAGQEKLPITLSFGVAQFRPDDTPQRVFDRADKALYAAKEAGRNQVRSGEPA